MTEIVKETIRTKVGVGEPEPPKVSETETAERTIYYLFGVIDVLLGFRLAFKLAGANPGSAFVSFIYGVTRIFILPFEGIFRRAVAEGVETVSVLEPATVVAIAVYILLAWGIVKLVRIFSGEKEE